MKTTRIERKHDTHTHCRYRLPIGKEKTQTEIWGNPFSACTRKCTSVFVFFGFLVFFFPGGNLFYIYACAMAAIFGKLSWRFGDFKYVISQLIEKGEGFSWRWLWRFCKLNGIRRRPPLVANVLASRAVYDSVEQVIHLGLALILAIRTLSLCAWG